MPEAPHEFPRRILLAAAGLSPQVVTETLFALAVKGAPAFVPTEVHLITTAEGEQRARLSLLSDEPGWFYRFLNQYGLEGIAFDSSRIHVLQDAGGSPLPDIRSGDDNRCAADAITELVRQLTLDANSALHVSLAGGRKTMGYYLGYALSLFGRPQDRLSHVLVSPPFEAHPDFYFPTRARRVIYTPMPESRPLDTSTAEVTLAEIPFVRLRGELPKDLLTSPGSFHRAVEAAQRQMGRTEVVIDVTARTLFAGGLPVPLPPAELAFYAWFARRRSRGLPPLPCPADGGPDPSCAAEYLKEYRAIVGEMADLERTEKSLRKGMEKAYFLERRSRLRHALRTALGRLAEPYEIKSIGRRPNTTYQLGLEAAQIRFCQTTPEQHHYE